MANSFYCTFQLPSIPPALSSAAHTAVHSQLHKRPRMTTGSSAHSSPGKQAFYLKHNPAMGAWGSPGRNQLEEAGRGQSAPTGKGLTGS